jgi:broad specificity phosphatase PhoE
MRVYLVRHGETLENRAGVVQGHDQGTLSPLGEDQAIRLSLRFLRESFDAIYSSDLRRAADTAEMIANYQPGTPIYLTQALRERCWGAHEGRTHAEILREAGISSGGSLPLAKGAETKPELYERASKLIRELYTKHKHETILLVGHNGINKALLESMTGRDPEKILEEKIGSRRFDNTSVSIIRVDDKSYEIELLNCTKHLE